MKTKENIRIIEDYTARTARLDVILDKLTKYFCANTCKEGIEGCCMFNAYKFDVLEEMLELQEEEALKNGWETEGSKCKYHSATGCKLTLFKPPVCINFLCTDLKNHIEEKYGINGRIFASLIGKANSFCLNQTPKERENLFSYMDKGIYLGEKLAESAKQKQEEAR